MTGQSDGSFCSINEVVQEVSTFCESLFTSPNPTTFDAVLSGIPVSIDSSMNAQLVKSISYLEVKNAVFSLPSNKSPSLDGMTPCFYQKFWNIIGDDVVRAISSFSSFWSFIVFYKSYYPSF